MNENHSEHAGFTRRNSESRCLSTRLTATVRSLCSRTTLIKRLPICQWLPSYSLWFLFQDCIAGITVGLTAIPQGIAYAVVAGLQPQFGLYAGFMGSFVYVFFGSCKDITIGPTAILALMVQPYVLKFSADYAILATFLAGCIILLLGLLHLGFLVQFISMPVTVGFTSGAALTIMASQLKPLFGTDGKSNNFLEAVINLFKHIHTVKLWDSVLGFSTIIILLLLKHLGKYGSKTSNPDISYSKNLLRKFNWIACLGRNAIVVIFGCVLAWALKSQYGTEPFALTGKIQEGLPAFGPPPFSTKVGNQTQNFSYMASELGTTLITLPLIAILETVAIAKAFSKGKIIDASQEMIALGLSNIFGSFFKSMPTTGSFTRTAVNNASGVQTPAGGIFTGCLVLFALGLLTKAFYFIPKASLAGLIVCAMLFMVEYEVAILLWRRSKLELSILLLTFLSSLLLSLEAGICIGVSCDAAFVLYRISKPTIISQYHYIENSAVLLVTLPQSAIYSTADHLTRYIMSKSLSYPNSILVINAKDVTLIDATVAKSFKPLLDYMQTRNQQVILWKFSPQAIDKIVDLVPKAQSIFCNEDTLEDVIKGYNLSNSTDDQSQIPLIR